MEGCIPLRVLKKVNRSVSGKHLQEAISFGYDEPVINLHLPGLAERVPLILLPSSFRALPRIQCVYPFDQLQNIPVRLKQGEAALPQSFHSPCLNSPACSPAPVGPIAFPVLAPGLDAKLLVLLPGAVPAAVSPWQMGWI